MGRHHIIIVETTYPLNGPRPRLSTKIATHRANNGIRTLINIRYKERDEKKKKRAQKSREKNSTKKLVLVNVQRSRCRKKQRKEGNIIAKMDWCQGGYQSIVDLIYTHRWSIFSAWSVVPERIIRTHWAKMKLPFFFLFFFFCAPPMRLKKRCPPPRAYMKRENESLKGAKGVRK